MVTAEQVPLTSLRIIRGLTLYKPRYLETDPGYNLSRQGLSLLVGYNKLVQRSDIGMRELQLPALQGLFVCLFIIIPWTEQKNETHK